MLRATAIAILGRALRDESAATLVEYALVLALIAVACIGAMMFMYTKISSSFTTISNTL
ncbi:MAG: Flp family type IVb pilin [Candidatus Baltobacteraceae bacterium]